MKKETRNLTSEQAEVRASKDSREVEGYAIVFNSESRDMGGFKEVVLPEALDGVLENADVLALLNHDQSRGLLARSTQMKGSLSLSVDDKGLRYKFTAPATQLGDEVLEGISRGDIRTSSFAFAVDDSGQDWKKQADGTFLRTITSFADIMDVSAVYKEAYPDTSVALRSMEGLREKPDVKPKEKRMTFSEMEVYYKQQSDKTDFTKKYNT